MLFVPSPTRGENTLEGPWGSVWEFRAGWVLFQSQKETLDGDGDASFRSDFSAINQQSPLYMITSLDCLIARL